MSVAPGPSWGLAEARKRLGLTSERDIIGTAGIDAYHHLAAMIEKYEPQKRPVDPFVQMARDIMVTMLTHDPATGAERELVASSTLAGRAKDIKAGKRDDTPHMKMIVDLLRTSQRLEM